MLNLYAETVFEVKPATNNCRLEFQVPRRNGSYNNTSKYSPSRKAWDHYSGDESDFQDRCLASSSSFYFRETKQYPRVFQWRLKQDRKILEIQPADLSRSEKDQNEAYLILSFEFQEPILPLGISFADASRGDELHAFVCTSRNEIFNLRLPTEYFRSPDIISQDITAWCRPVDASSLTIDTVYHLYASSPYELFVAFTSGRIQALRRKADSENWSQDYYDDSSWGSTLRGIVSRRGQQQIEYGSLKLAATTVQGMIASPDTNYLYTVCLNHTLRVWHLPTGRLVETRDLLNVNRDQGERLQLSPFEPGLVRLVRHPKGRYPMLVTYTPHEGGQFKFWNIKGGLTDPLQIEDRYPKVNLNPPDPDPTGNTVWSLIGFEITPGSELKPSQMWVLWRNNNYHQVYTLHFDFPTLADNWESSWVKALPSSSRSRGPDFVPADSQDVTSKWLDFLFFPGRYSTAVLETALARYRSLTSDSQPSIKGRSLRERMCSIVAASVSLRKYENAEVDFERFAIDTDHQWRNYWRIVESLNDGRYAPLSLCFDIFSEMAWIAMADYSTALRECSKAELLQLNSAHNLENLDEITAERWPYRKTVNDVERYAVMANVIQAAEKFRKTFTPELANDLWTAIEEELYTQSEIPTPDRIVLIFNQVGFSEGLSEGAEERLLQDLQPIGGVDGVNNDIFTAILDVLSTPTKRPKSSLRSTLFGSDLLSAAILDDVIATKQILLNLLILTIFIDESENFDPPELFEKILSTLKGQERIFWLATHFRPVPLEFLGSSAKSRDRIPSDVGENNTRQTTILDDILIKNIRPQPPVDRPMMYLLTDLVAESQRWASGKDAVTPEDAAVHIQCDLIVHSDFDLATEFLIFQPSTSWSTYVKGRLRLARDECLEASIYFRRSAHILACGKAVGDLREFSAGLLSVLDAEHFNNGLPRYFEHVVALFESKEAYAQAAEFAHLSLESLTPGQDDPVPNFRAEMLSRLFTAELKCARFNSAYEALVALPDRALQRALVATLVNAVLDPQSAISGTDGALRTLQRLPWSLHPHLAENLDQCLHSMAKKQTSVPLSGQLTHSGKVDYLSVLYAIRLSKNDHRGAVYALFDRLRIIQSGRARTDPQATSLRHTLLALINALACVPSDEAYILVQDEALTNRRGQPSEAEPTKRRKIITLDSIRKEYQSVIDKCSRIERGDVDFGVDDDSDEEAEDTQMNGM